MKSLLAVAALTAMSFLPRAEASDLRMTVEAPHFTCEGAQRFYSRVAYNLDDNSAAPLPCCDGKIGCAQFLSTNTVVHQAHEWHG